MRELRIGLISDVHLGPDFGFQAGSKAMPLLRGFLAAMKDFQPDLVVDLGDRINNVDHDLDLENLRLLLEAYSSLPCPVRFVPGNHDLLHLDLKEVEDVLGQEQGARLEEWNGWPVFFSNTEDSEFLKIEFEDYLQRSTGERPIIIFSHRPLQEVPLNQNRLFPPGVKQSAPWGAEFLKRVKQRGWRPICINGHLHWNHAFFGGIAPQVTVPSLVETWESGEPSGSFAELILKEGECQIHVQGKLPAHYVFAGKMP